MTLKQLWLMATGRRERERNWTLEHYSIRSVKRKSLRRFIAQGQAGQAPLPNTPLIEQARDSIRRHGKYVDPKDEETNGRA